MFIFIFFIELTNLVVVVGQLHAGLGKAVLLGRQLRRRVAALHAATAGAGATRLVVDVQQLARPVHAHGRHVAARMQRQVHDGALEVALRRQHLHRRHGVRPNHPEQRLDDDE